MINVKKVHARYLVFVALGAVILITVGFAYNQFSLFQHEKIVANKAYLENTLMQKILLRETGIDLLGISMVSFYENSDTVTTDEYDTYVKKMLKEMPDITNIFYLKNGEILQSYPHTEFKNSKFDSLFSTYPIIVDNTELMAVDYVIDDSQRIVLAFPYDLILNGKTILEDNFKIVLYNPLNSEDVIYQTGIMNGVAITEPIEFTPHELDSAIRIQKQTDFFDSRAKQHYVLNYQIWSEQFEAKTDVFTQLAFVGGFIFAVIVPLLLIQTERYRIRDQVRSKTLEQVNKQLIDIDRKKGEFSSMMAHELKTPLVPILGNVDFLKSPKMINKLDSMQIEAIDSIEKNGRRLEGLISDLLDAQKIHLDKMKFNKSVFDAKKFMESVRANLIHYTKEKQIIFVNNTPDSFELVTDENRLRQVLGNLVKNSVDFVPDGGRIEIGTSVSDNSALFYVKDSGIGITKEEQEHLFKKFYQTDTSIRRKHGGTGLGLAICKGIVEGLGGKIWFESKEGVGTTFYFTIPLEDQKVKVKSP